MHAPLASISPPFAPFTQEAGHERQCRERHANRVGVGDRYPHRHPAVSSCIPSQAPGEAVVGGHTPTGPAGHTSLARPACSPRVPRGLMASCVSHAGAHTCIVRPTRPHRRASGTHTQSLPEPQRYNATVVVFANPTSTSMYRYAPRHQHGARQRSWGMSARANANIHRLKLITTVPVVFRKDHLDRDFDH